MPAKTVVKLLPNAFTLYKQLLDFISKKIGLHSSPLTIYFFLVCTQICLNNFKIL